MNDEIPEQPTPDSLTLFLELADLFSGPEWNEFLAAQKELHALLKREAEIEKTLTDIFATMQERVGRKLHITAEAIALRFQIRECGVVAKDAIHVSGRISRPMTALSEKIAALINEE